MEMLKFISPIKLEGYCDNDEDISIEIQYENISDHGRYCLFRDMRTYLDEDFDIPRFGRGLAMYLHNNDCIKSIVKSIMLDFIEKDNQLYTEILCISNKKLNDEEIKNLKEYITGQFSDGFGEGFEQHTFYLENNKYTRVYVSMWCDKDWDLKLINRINFE